MAQTAMTVRMDNQQKAQKNAPAQTKHKQQDMEL